MAIKWVDRVPTRANRVLVTPENGGTPYYATITRADEPSVVGTPVNAANLNAMQAAAGLSANRTIYVSTTGSDTLGDGSATNKYATIQKAISTLPQNLNGFDATISIADGIYEEDVLIARTFGGNIIFTGTEGASVSIRSLRVSYGSVVRVQNIALNVTGNFNNNAIAITSASFISLSNITLSGGAENGLYLNYDGYAFVAGDLFINNTTYAAINATNRSSVFVRSISGSTTAGSLMRSVNGSLISYDILSATAPTLYGTRAGGRIYADAQMSAPNY